MAIIKRNNGNDQADPLQALQDAVDTKDGQKFLIELFRSLLLEAYERQFKKLYDQLAPEDIHDIIGEAVDYVYVKVTSGGSIGSVKSYLWKVIDRKLSEFSREYVKIEGSDTVENIGALDSVHDAEFVESAKEELQKRRAHAINIAEGLIPKIGLTNPMNVLKYLFGAIRNGAEDVTSREIGDALGLTPENARQSLKRGLERLGRIFKEEGLVDPAYILPLEDITLIADEIETEGEENY